MPIPPSLKAGARLQNTQRPDQGYWTVLQVSPRGVRLLSDVGTSDLVYPDQWPGSYVDPHAAATSATRAPYLAILFGGAAGEHFLRLQNLARAQGVDIRYHVASDKRANLSIPGDVELVIFLISHTSHGSYYEIKEQAKRRGLAQALCPSAGFSAALQAELTRLASVLPSTPARFGQTPPPGWWEWNDQERAFEYEDGSSPPPSSGAGDTVLSLTLLLAILARALR